MELGPIKIPAHGKTNNFLVNYYGPPSGYKLANTDYPPWNTFPRFSMYQVLDTKEYDLPGENDIDWMSQFMPGEVPTGFLQWMMSKKTRNDESDGLGKYFDKANSLLQ